MKTKIKKPVAVVSKTYVLDTSTIAYHPLCFKSFKQNNVIIPIPVLEELDKLKTYGDEVGKNARLFMRTIDQIIKNTDKPIHQGIEIDDGIILKIDANIVHNETLGSALYGDNRILSYCLNLVSAGNNVVLVSRDIALRIRANAYGIPSQDYVREDASINDNPTILKEFRVSDADVNSFYQYGLIEISDEEIADFGLKCNEFLCLKNKLGEEVGYVRFISENKHLRRINNTKNLFGIQAKNLEQQLAIDLLLDDDVKLVILSGKAGTGKGIISIAASLFNVLERSDKKYEKLLIMKPMVSVSKEIGFLPGSIEEKYAPYIASYKDNLNIILKRNKKSKGIADPYVSLLFENGTIEIEAMAFLRGRSIPNAIIIADEFQNCSNHELKTLLTRAAEGTKIILLGDCDQVDTPGLTSEKNGLFTAITKFADQEIAGTVILSKGERSELSELAAKLL